METKFTHNDGAMNLIPHEPVSPFLFSHVVCVDMSNRGYLSA